MAGKGSRKDPAWKYGVEVAPPDGANKSYKYIKCNFCNKIITGGVSRMKAHLGGTHKNVAPCCQVPQEVRDEIKEYVKQFETAKFQYQRDFEERVDAGAYFSTGGSGTGSVSVE
ncbi:putative transcription factor/ chromatin remodeling BED-type(Zn) family [Helianthus annuus]|nr:putative transcription factor/ chromatin remodeling BED-type(Zn) family [Helianthus annuus]